MIEWNPESYRSILESLPTGGSGKTGVADNLDLTKDNMKDLKAALLSAVSKSALFENLKNQIDMTITAEGLRIELLENETGTFFPSGAAAPTEAGKEILVALAQELGKLPNTVAIEGHTDAKPFVGTGTYSNWELSSYRGNAARRSDAAARPRSKSGDPGPRLRGSTPAEAEQSGRCVQSTDHVDCALRSASGCGRRQRMSVRRSGHNVYNRRFGPWRSLASALAWGARGPGFKSRRPDQPISNLVVSITSRHPTQFPQIRQLP